MAILFDGDYWHNKPEHIERDKRFNQYAAKLGIRVVRVRGSEHKNTYDILRQRIIETAGLQPCEVPAIPTTFSPQLNPGGDVQLCLSLPTFL